MLVLDAPDPSFEVVQALAGGETRSETACSEAAQGDDRLFAACIAAQREFHIDPYGGMSFCYFVKDPALRFDLRQGSFSQAWDEFIPGLAETVRGGPEYLQNCGSCDLRSDCRWCAVYGYLEHGRFSAKVDYLCQVAAANRRYKEDWKLEHLRYYQIAGLTIQVAAGFPITENTFDSKFSAFRVDGPGEDTISIRLESPIPARTEIRLGKEFYRHPPWAIYRQSQSWVYMGIQPDGSDDEHPHGLAIFDADHSRGSIYRPEGVYEKGGFGSLTTFPSDQILLARVLADRQGCYLHSSGIIMDGQGLLFVGHSEAGKSTMLKMLRESGEILCDDRNIVRRWPEGFKVHGTWSHGELSDVSPAGAPLRAILFLEKAGANELIPISDKMERIGKILSYVVRPLVDAGWWEKTLDLAEMIADEVPAYRLRFDKSGGVQEVIQTLL